MEKFQKTILRLVSLQKFIYIAQTPLKADSKDHESTISNINGFSENLQRCIKFP